MKKKRMNKIGKPVFHKVFWKKLLVWMMVAVVIGFVGSTVAIQVFSDYVMYEWGNHSGAMYAQVELMAKEYYGDEKTGELSKNTGEAKTSDKNDLSLYKKELNEAEKEEQFKLWIEYLAYVYSYYDTAYMLLDADTLDTVAQSSYNKMYWLARPEGEVDDSEDGAGTDFTIYVCEDESIVKQIRDIYAETDYDEEGMLRVLVEDMYVKGFTCVPGKVKLIGLSFADEMNHENVVKELDFTPDDITGYTHVETNEMIENNELTGNFWHHNDMSEFGEWANKTKEEMVSDPIYKEDFKSSSGFGVACTEFGIQEQIDFAKVSVGEGDSAREFWFATFNRSSFWELYATEMVLINVGIVFVALVIALISAYTAYIKQKSYYEMDQYRRDMTNTMAHDLKSPLMVISGFAENLLEQDLGEKSKHFTNSILDNVQYMNQIIEKVLELSKVENAEYKLEIQNVDLRKLSEKLAKNYISQMDEHSLEIKISGECEVRADELCMTQVLDNLIGNAVKYSMEGSVIEIQLTDKMYKIVNRFATKLDVDVKDLVNPFVKGDNSRSGKKGSGLGLTIAKNLVEQQGYRLELEADDGVFSAEIYW